MKTKIFFGVLIFSLTFSVFLFSKTVKKMRQENEVQKNEIVKLQKECYILHENIQRVDNALSEYIKQIEISNRTHNERIKEIEQNESNNSWLNTCLPDDIRLQFGACSD